MSISVEAGTGICIPFRHFEGGNAKSEQMIPYLRDAIWTNPDVVKVAYNLSFESMFLYAQGIVVQAPCYDTIATAQMTLKNPFEFRGIGDSG